MSALLQLLPAKILEFPRIADERGALCFVEGQKHIPFNIKRVYFISDVPVGASRGTHAHKTLHQVFCVVSGSLTIDLDDGNETKSYKLCRADQGLYVPSGYWRNMRDFTEGTTCVALASAAYDVDDYIHDYAEYQEWRQSKLECLTAPTGGF